MRRLEKEENKINLDAASKTRRQFQIENKLEQADSFSLKTSSYR